jgi:hypothetical protein
MNNPVLLVTIIALAIGLAYTIYAIVFDSEELPDEPPKRARKKGKFIADDPSTPNVNEAWEGGVAPKRKRGRPKGSKNKPKTKK